MAKPVARPERRRPDRPDVGDWKQCPICAAGMLVFTEWYRAKGSFESPKLAMPAWVCDQCPHVTFVRAEHQPPALREGAKKVRAAANRRLMKARFVRGRADRALRKSLSRKRR